MSIIGSGFGMYGLLPAFSKISNCEITSICGKDSVRMQKYCTKFGLNRYSDWKEMIQNEKPNALAIAVIPKYQHEIIKYAMKNEIAVFAEKPLTTSIKDSVELSELAKEKKLPNMIDFIFPEIPEWLKAKKIIESKVKGDIRKIDVEWMFLSYDLKNKIKSWKTDVSHGGGALSYFFSHVLYYLEYFVGKIKNVESQLYSSKKSLNQGETEVLINVLFENGCIGNIHLNIASIDKQTHSIKFLFDNGSISLENNSADVIDGFELNDISQNKIKKIEIANNLKLYQNEFEDSRVKVIKLIAEKFIQWCNTGTPSKPDFQDGLRVQELIEIVRKSASKDLVK